VWDEDSLFGDDIIGETVIDLDDRYFQIQWRTLQEKPVEVRELHTSLSKLSQGTITMWADLEANPSNKEAAPPEVKKWQLEPEPEQELEVRISIMSTRNVPNYDAEGTSDVFIKTIIDEDEQETDTHWRCTTGKASFNYRILSKVKTPRPAGKKCYMQLQCFDRDVFTKNEIICEWILDITPMIDNVRLSYKPTHLEKKMYDNVLGKDNRMDKNTN
jgi:hypothetical protein